MYEYKALVTRVVDGDTFEMKVDLGFDISVNTIFRLKDIDTPETWRPRNEAERAHGEQATLAVKDLIEGEIVTIRTYKKGKYGRYICDVIINDVNLADYIISKDLVKRDSY